MPPRLNYTITYTPTPSFSHQVHTFQWSTSCVLRCDELINIVTNLELKSNLIPVQYSSQMFTYLNLVNPWCRIFNHWKQNETIFSLTIVTFGQKFFYKLFGVKIFYTFSRRFQLQNNQKHEIFHFWKVVYHFIFYFIFASGKFSIKVEAKYRNCNFSSNFTIFISMKLHQNYSHPN